MSAARGLVAGRSVGVEVPADAPRRRARCTPAGTRPRGPVTFFWSLSQGAATFRSPAKTRTSMTGRPRRTAYSCSRQAAVIAPSSACGQSITSGRFGPIARREAPRGRRSTGRAHSVPLTVRRTRSKSGGEAVSMVRNPSAVATPDARPAAGSTRQQRSGPVRPACRPATGRRGQSAIRGVTPMHIKRTRGNERSRRRGWPGDGPSRQPVPPLHCAGHIPSRQPPGGLPGNSRLTREPAIPRPFRRHPAGPIPGHASAPPAMPPLPLRPNPVRGARAGAVRHPRQVRYAGTSREGSARVSQELALKWLRLGG